MRILGVVLCLALAVGGLACDRSQQSTRTDSPPVSAPTSPAAAAKVTAIELGNQIGADGQISSGAARTTFTPGDTIYASVLTDRPPAGATLSARWTYEDGQVVSEGHESLTITSSDRNATEFHISKPDGWPTGRYRVEIALNGQPAGARDFEVR
jgi:hypothetical protein